MYVVALAIRDPGFVSDFDQIWLAGRALLAGENPYRAVATGFAGHAGLPFPLFYPLPAVVAGVPFALMPLVAARAAFAAVSLGAFAYLLAGPVLKHVGPQVTYRIGGVSALAAAIMLVPLLRLRHDPDPDTGAGSRETDADADAIGEVLTGGAPRYASAEALEAQTYPESDRRTA